MARTGNPLSQLQRAVIDAAWWRWRHTRASGSRVMPDEIGNDLLAVLRENEIVLTRRDYDAVVYHLKKKARYWEGNHGD